MPDLDLQASHIEALIFASENGLTISELQQYFYTENEQQNQLVYKMINRIKAKYSAADFGIELSQIGERYQFLTKEHTHEAIQKMQAQRIQRSLSQAAMETLAIIAYKQPCVKSDVEAIRGVNCDYSVERLLEKNLIMINGQLDAPGRPLIYITTPQFMDYLGISSLNELPPVKEIPGSDVTE